MLLIAVGVLWSNVLGYTDATIAPRDRMAELQHIGELVKGKGPTFENEYEVYGDRHFLREGAPVEPAEYRPVTVPLRNGAVLTKTAWANLDAFPLSTLLPYRSIVTRRSPAESRPPSIWHLVYQGRYYQLWQRPQAPTETILEHIPYGEENTYPYCGNAEGGSTQAVCAVNPVSIPSCPQLQRIGKRAAKENAHLVAYQRAEPDFVRGDEMRGRRKWLHQPESHTLTLTTPGTAVGEIAVPSTQTYELFLGGNFGRGMEVKVDGRKVGSIKNQLSGFINYVPIAKVYLTQGVHKFEYTYPHADLSPGSGENIAIPAEYKVDFTFSGLSAVVLQPLQYPRSELITLAGGRSGAPVRAPAGMGGGRLQRMTPYVVVGAGPTGAAAAKALTAAGERVIVIDAGLTLEPQREAARRRMAATLRTQWSQADVALTGFSANGRRRGLQAAVRLRRRLPRRPARSTSGSVAGVAARPSYALGGLSNVWGAGVLPYTDRDLEGWPLGAAELAEGYRAAFD